MTLSIGDVINTRNIRAVHPTGWSEYKAPKGAQFVFLFLGAEEIADGGKKLDPNEMLRALGWSPPPDIPDQSEICEVSDD